MSGFKVEFSVLNLRATPGIYADALASRPAAGYPGRVFIDTDNPSTGIYRDTGTVWVQIAETATSDVDTLQNVTDNGNTTTNSISVGHANTPLSTIDVRQSTSGLNNASNWTITANNNPTIASGATFGTNYVNAIYGAQTQLFLQNATIGNSGLNTAGLFINTLQSNAPGSPGIITVTQASTIRAISGAQTGIFYGGTNVGVTYSHVAALKTFQPINTGSAATVTNNYGIIVADSTPSSGTVTYTNRWGIYQEGASDKNYFAANVLIGSTTDGGQRLQVTGDVLFKGSGNTSGTTALTVQNSDGNSMFRVDNNFKVMLGTFNFTGFFPTNNGSSALSAGFSIRFLANTSTQAQSNFYFRSVNSLTATSGTQNTIVSNDNFSPTSGTAVFTNIALQPEINQTGGANGITRGLYVNPTLTAAADWRSIEWSNNSGWGLYGAGTAANFLSGNTIIGGSAVDGGQKLQVTGDAIITGSGNTNSTFALTVRNSNATNSFRIRNDGVVLFQTVLPITATSTLEIYGGSGAITAIRLRSTGTSTHTSGERINIGITDNFAPTSGTGTQSTFAIEPIINQTGGANGASRGILIRPTLTAAADWRSIEWSNNSGFGIYGSGTATNYINGTLAIKTTTPNAAALLQIDSTTQGFLTSRATTAEIKAVTTPPAGLFMYSTDDAVLAFYDGTGWRKVNHSAL